MQDQQEAVSGSGASAGPRLHAVWQRGQIGLWCETGVYQPRSVAPAANFGVLAESGAPSTVLAAIGETRAGTRIAVRVPVDGEVKNATVPGIRLSIPRAVAALAQVGPQDQWAGPSVQAFAALSRGVAAFVRAGHVVPAVHKVGDEWDVAWVLVDSPMVSSWARESAARCHGLLSAADDSKDLLGALATCHARDVLSRVSHERRSGLGAALAFGRELSLAGSALSVAAQEFAQFGASRGVDVVLRLLEPGSHPADTDAGADAQAVVQWRLEVLVRVDDIALRPVSELVDPGSVSAAVQSHMQLALKVWPPLREAIEASGSADLLLPTPLVVALVDTGVEALRAWGIEVLLPRAWTRVRSSVRASPAESKKDAVDSGRHLGMQQLADIDWEVVVDGEPVDAIELHDLLSSASDLVRLRGRWVRADLSALRRAAQFLAARLGDKPSIARYATALASQEAEGLEVEGPEPAEWLAAANREVNVTLPSWFSASLRPYQLQGVRWLAATAASGCGAVLADDMGLGKTMQVLALSAAEQVGGITVIDSAADSESSGETKSALGPTVVVVPLSLLPTWRREAAHFAPKLAVYVHYGAARLRGEQALSRCRTADLVLTSYGTVVRDCENLSGIKWRRIVVDEAQTIKNPTTTVSRAVRSLEAEHRIALTGTPIENRLAELRAVLDFANPGILGDASTFRARFAVPIEAHRDENAASRLRALSAPFILRRVKSDPTIVADLPEKQHIRVDAPLTREQASLYQAAVDDMLEQLKGVDAPARAGRILSGLTALKQICNHPAHYLADGSSLLRGGKHRSGKLAALDAVLAEILDHSEKALIFTQYRAFGEMILPMLSRRAACEVPFLHGGLSTGARAELVEDFQGVGGPPLMLASLRAGGTGLTLTQANHVVHLDRWWNPAVENQATDRVHRIGQTRQVQVRTFVAPGTVEDRIDELLESKRDLAELTLGQLTSEFGSIAAIGALEDSEIARLVALDTAEVGAEAVVEL